MREDFLLLNPGPVPVQHAVTKAMDEPMLSRRSDDFGDLYDQICNGFETVLATSAPDHPQSVEDGTTILMNGTATMALEAVIAGLLGPEDTALVIDTGQFGDRIGLIAARYGSVLRVEAPPGTAVDVGTVAETAARIEPTLIAVVHNETSTGLENLIEPIGTIATETGAMLLVDGVSSIGGMEFRFEDWNVDAVVTDPQKALAAPPGISAIYLSERAVEAVDGRHGPFYQNLEMHIEAAAERRTPFTCASPLFRGLAVALETIEEEGMAARIERHRRYAGAVRASMDAMGLSLFPDPSGAAAYSDTLTAVSMPDDVDPDRFDRALTERGISVGGGLGPLDGQLIRISTMGALSPAAIVRGVHGIGMALETAGADIDVWAGVSTCDEEIRG